MVEKWFIEREGEVYGPADATELSQWIEEGRLDAGDLLWPENADRSEAVPAETALRGLGLTLGRAELPVVDLGAAADLYELPLGDPSTVGADLPVVDLGAVAEPPAEQQPAKAKKPVPDWVQSLAKAVDTDRRKPRPVRPDWLEDVRLAEQAVRRPARRGETPGQGAGSGGKAGGNAPSTPKDKGVRPKQ